MLTFLTKVQVSLAPEELIKLRRWARLKRGAPTTELADGLRAALAVAAETCDRMPLGDDDRPEPEETEA